MTADLYTLCPTVSLYILLQASHIHPVRPGADQSRWGLRPSHPCEVHQYACGREVEDASGRTVQEHEAHFELRRLDEDEFASVPSVAVQGFDLHEVIRNHAVLYGEVFSETPVVSSSEKAAGVFLFGEREKVGAPACERWTGSLEYGLSSFFQHQRIK